MHAANALPLCAVGCILTGCATAPSNLKFDRDPDGYSDYTFRNWIDTRPYLDKDLIVLSFSGGGLRAAALAASVLSELKKQNLDRNVAIISSTSGGSVTAGYFAAKGSAGLDDFSKNFLQHQNTSDLTFRLLPSFISGANRSVQFADYLDQRLFEGKAVKYQDLVSGLREAPFVILNASDASSGKTFEFTQHSFSTLCSDLNSFRLTEAIAASAAFPFLMTPISLKNHWNEDSCPKWLFCNEQYSAAVQNRFLKLDEFVAWRQAHSLRYTYSDPKTNDPNQAPHRRIEYVHLIDGGLSDNLAVRALIRAFGTRAVEKLQEKGVERILLIQVNAKTEEMRSMDNSDSIPSWIQIFKTVALNPIDVASELSSFISAQYWVSLIRYVNAPSDEHKQRDDVLRFYPVQVDFDQMEVNHGDWKANRKAQWDLKQIPTNWTLSSDHVKQVEEAGRSLLNAHPCFATFLWDSSPKQVGNRPTGCDFIDAEPKRYVQVSEPSKPTASAPLPAAAAMRPAGLKVTLAADALFDFNKADLRAEGKAKLDKLASDIKGIKLEVIIAVGHADRFGTDAYNQKLSEMRAEAVKGYLVSKGVEPDRVYTEGKGKKQPITKADQCKGPKSKKVVDCLQPDRRVEIEAIGTQGRY
jgi:OOP family OmpA-OmpF porin